MFTALANILSIPCTPGTLDKAANPADVEIPKGKGVGAMNAHAVQTGQFSGGLPFVRVGNEAKQLVIFPGLADAAWDVTSPSWDMAEHYGRLADEYSVFIISRKRGLPDGYTTKDMAGDYAAVFARELGPCPVVGISLGGCIAQHFAADYPQYVQQLVLACAGHRVSDEGRKIPSHWLELAQQERWSEFYFNIAKVTLQEFHHTFYQFLLPLVRLKSPDPSDFLVSLEASLSHEGGEALRRIKAPTLVIGGEEDVFFSPAVLRETAQRIPDATLHFIDGGGHGAYELQRAEFESAVLTFLADTIDDGRLVYR